MSFYIETFPEIVLPVDTEERMLAYWKIWNLAYFEGFFVAQFRYQPKPKDAQLLYDVCTEAESTLLRTFGHDPVIQRLQIKGLRFHSYGYGGDGTISIDANRYSLWKSIAEEASDPYEIFDENRSYSVSVVTK